MGYIVGQTGHFNLVWQAVYEKYITEFKPLFIHNPGELRSGRNDSITQLPLLKQLINMIIRRYKYSQVKSF